MEDQPDVLICSTTSHYLDDKKGNCNGCGVAIVYRPHAPTPKLRLCAKCGLAEMKKQNKPVGIKVTDETIREMKEHLSAEKN